MKAARSALVKVSLLAAALLVAVLLTMGLPDIRSGHADEFVDGTFISGFGRYAPVEGVSFGPEDKFRVVFDVAQGGEAGEVNRRFNNLARFLNMHTGHGARPENLQLALVVHGSATVDLLDAEAYQAKTGEPNANLPLLQALLKSGVKVVVCGQSVAGHELNRADLLPGVAVDVSAMTANARLLQAGYTLNPF